MSSGWSLARSVEVSSMLSMRMSGLVLAPKVVIPRTKKSALSWPGSPERWYAMIPATFPASAVVRLLDGTFNVCTSMAVTEPITLSFFCFPNATTTASSSWFLSSESLMMKLVMSPTLTIWATFPIASNLRLSEGFTPASVNEPSALVATPLVVPAMVTAAPIIGSPVSSS